MDPSKTYMEIIVKRKRVPEKHLNELLGKGRRKMDTSINLADVHLSDGWKKRNKGNETPPLLAGS